MKILYLVTKGEMGGAQTHVLQLCQYFKSQGHEVAVMSNNDAWLKDKVLPLGVKYYQNPYFSNSFNPIKHWQAGQYLQTVIKEFKPHILHCHSSFAGIVGRLFAHKDAKVIFTAHGWSFNEGVPLAQKIFGILSEKVCAYFTYKIIACAGFVKDLALKYQVADANKIEVVYNGVEIENFEFAEKVFPNPVEIVMVARLAAPKDPLMVCQAFNLLPESVKQKAQFTIIGDGPLMAPLKQYVSDNQLSAYIKTPGQKERSEVFKVLKRSSVFVLCSHWEGFPYTILEAMSYGLAIISSDVGGVNEALKGEGGILVENKVENWKKALEMILSDQGKISHLGQKAFLKARAEFSLPIMFSKIEKIYLQAIK